MGDHTDGADGPPGLRGAGRVPIRVRWMPGLGLAVWPDSPTAETPRSESPAEVDVAPPGAVFGEHVDLPAALVDLLGAKRLRHTVELRSSSGRVFRPAAGLGIRGAVELLDRCEHLRVGGDIRFYRYLLAAARSCIDAGAVVPGTRQSAGEFETRWTPLPVPAWHSWLAVAQASAPTAAVPTADGLVDFVTEAVDHECRRRLADDGVTPTVPFVADLVRRAPVIASPETGSRSLQAWQDWAGSAGVGRSAVVLRLHQPEDDPDSPDPGLPDPGPVRWRLEVCLRPATGELRPADPRRLDAHELDAVAGDLGRAVEAFDALARAEADPRSLDYLLTTDTVAELLDHGAADLQAAGLNVLLPSSIAAVTPSLHVRAAQVPDGGARVGFVGLDEISEFEWKLALGDGDGTWELSGADIDELAQQSGDLVRLRGTWMRAEGAALHRAASFIAAHRTLGGREAPTMAELLSLVTDPDDRLPVPVTEVSGLGWLDDIASGGVLRPDPVTVPPSLRATLRPYQRRGLDWLHALAAMGAGGVLADDMGLGKTVQVIALLTVRRDGAPRGAPGPVGNGPGPVGNGPGLVDNAPALVVCPMSVIGNWQREIATFAPHLRVLVHHGAGRSTDAITEAAPDVVLTTFATLARDRADLAALRWNELVVDEAQHVKNVNTAAARALRAVRASTRIALTGTPVENRLEDLRAVIDLVNPGMLGTASTFRSRFAEPIERDRDQRAVDRLSAVTRPFILRRQKNDPTIAPDLPDKSELLVRTNLTTEQAGIYQAVLNELHAALADTGQGGPRRRTVLAALTRLKQVCNHPAHYLDDGSPMLRRGRHRSGKLELLVDVLSTLIAEGDRALIFTQFAAFGALLSEWLEPVLGAELPVLDGSMPRAERDRLVTRFGGDDGPPALLATLKAGGTGLNLVAATHVIHIDRWWNPAVEDQATDRAYRIGQTRNVQVRKFICVGTLEERIDEMITAKRELSSLTVNTGESWLTDLDDDSLMDLLSLRDEAVSE
ncbi:DEAD/DEAH box helicase [Gordonia shandongensis]|uniref:DEAD/DEAH box helicase n=1 Tax=Gordonia shandongensis TaxID=376351 RepID=UPI0006847416|nr:DEAD/DEAH box helicase [Gordonia shandongensis]